MATKIQKSILATSAVTLGSVLTQTVNADQLDDAVKDAQKAGFETNVTTKTVTVSTKSEADKLNQEEATRIQKLANDVRSMTEKAKSTDKYVESLRDGIQSTQRAVESTQSDANSKAIESAQIDYEKRVKAIEAHNKQLGVDYKAQKARVDEENRKLEEDYQFKKTQVDLKNQAANNKYIAELAAAKQRDVDYQKSLSEYNKKKETAESVREKRFADETLTADAKKVGVDIETATMVDKGTVSESDLEKLAADYETAKAEVRKTLAEAAAQNAEAAKVIQNHQNTTNYVNEQKQIVRDKVDADNRDLGTTNNITTTVREEVVTGPDASLDAIKVAYERIKGNLDDNHIRTLADATAYFKGKGLSDEEATVKAQDLIGTNALEKITEYKTRHSKDAIENGTSEYAKFVRALKSAGVTINYKDIHKSVTNLPIDAKLSDATNPAVTTYKNAINELDTEIAAVYAKNPDNEITRLLKSIMNNPADAAKSKVTLSENYTADLAEYDKVRSELGRHVNPQLLDSYIENPEKLKTELNKDLFSGSGDRFSGTAESIPNSHGGYNNQNNMTLKRSSDKVKYLQTPDLSSGNWDYGTFDTMNDRPTSETPIYNNIFDTRDNLMTEYTLVRIPKGESITVTYTLKDGGSYDQSGLNKSGMKLFQKKLIDELERKLGSKLDVKLSNNDAKDVKSIELRIVNNNAVGTGDIVVAVQNNTAEPFAIGVANGNHDVRKPWTLIKDSPTLAFDYTINARFKDGSGEYLSPAVSQYEVKSSPHRYKDAVMGTDITMQKDAYYKPVVSGAYEEKEYTTKKPSPINMAENSDGRTDANELNWQTYIPTSRALSEGLPSNYRDTHRLMSLTATSLADGYLIVNRKSYDKRLVEWGARNDANNNVKLIEKGRVAGVLSYPNVSIKDITIKPKPVEPSAEMTLPNASLELTREVVVPTVGPLPTSASEPVSIRSVVWKVKYKGTFNEPEPKKPEGEPVKPTVNPYPDKPVLKTQPEPPKKEVIPKEPESVKIAASSNSLTLKARIANKPKMNLERIRYVAENRFSSGNTLVVRGVDKTRRASSSNSLVVRTLSGSRRV